MADASFRRELGQQLRVDSVRASAAAGSGHPTSSMSAADLMAVLLDGYLKLDFRAPDDPRRDHLIFSKGHASPLYYAMLKAAGAIDDEELLDVPPLRQPARGSSDAADPADRRRHWLARSGAADRRRDRDRGQRPRPASVPRLGAVRRLGDGRGLDLGGVPARRLGGARQPRSRSSTSTASARRARRCSAGTWTATRTRARAFGWHAIAIDGHDVDADRRRVSRGGRRARSPDRRSSRGPRRDGRAGGRGPARQARQAARRSRRGDRGARRRARAARRSGRAIRRDRRAAPVRDLAGRAAALGARRGGRDARGVRRGAGGARPRCAATSSRSTARCRTRPFRAVRARPSRPLLRDVHRRAANGRGGGRHAGPRLGAVRLDVRGVPVAGPTTSSGWRRSPAPTCASSGSHAGVSIGEDGPSQMALEDLAALRAVHGSAVLHPSDANQVAQLVAEMADRSGISLPAHAAGKTAVRTPADEDIRIGGSRTVRASDDDRAHGRRLRDHRRRGRAGR